MSVATQTSLASLREKDLFARAAVVFAGLFAGGLSFVAVAVVPAWKSSTPQTYLESFQRILPGADPYFPIVGLLALFSYGLYLVRRRPVGAGQWARGFAPVVFLIIAFSVSVTVNVPINNWLANLETVPEAGELVMRQNRWAVGHWVRTLLALVAYLGMIWR